jgi:ketosteroid isomerase-like protein
MTAEEQIESLARRVQVLEDKDALAELLNRYCKTADAHDWEGWSGTLTEDCVFDAPIGKHSGREPVVAAAAEMHAVNEVLQHAITNMQFEVDGDRATGTASLLFQGVPDANKPTEHDDMGGPYEFQFRREPDGWRIEVMKLRAIWTNERG